MTDENTNQEQPEATPEPAEEKRGLFGRKRKKMTMKEQIREIMPLVYVVVLAGLGYGIYYAVTYNWAWTIELEDQHYEVHTVEFPREKPAVIAFLDQESSSQVQKWALKLFGTYGDRIDSYRIFDFSKLDPGHHDVARGLMTKLPVSVLIDYDGAVSKKYRFEGQEAALFVVSPSGTIEERVFGEMTDEKWTRLSTAVDELLDQSS